MVVDFSKLNLKERQTLILKNQDGTYIQPLVFTHNFEAKLCYNEVSEITFDVPAFVDCLKTPSYDDIVGMRLIDWYGIGQFILMDPSTTNDGIKEIKTCKAYSLEYELTFKQAFLEEGTYNFWNPFDSENTVLGILMKLLPSWRVGSVDASLIGKYRTFEASNTSVYDLMKNTLQDTYQCIFDFDTYNRTINVRAVTELVDTKPVYLSIDNLIKEINIEEDTQNIFTCLDVNGADGVDIRSVNPMGTNKIYNLDYFMNTTYFSQEMIDKWNAWKAKYESSQRPYYNLSIEKVLQESKLTVEEAALADLKADLSRLETLQATYVEAAAKNTGNSSDLTQVKKDIATKNEEISAKQKLVDGIKTSIKSYGEQQIAINESCQFDAFFSPSELELLDRYIKESAISEETFVYQTVSSYSKEDVSKYHASVHVNISDAKVVKNATDTGKEFFTVVGGTLNISADDDKINAEVVTAAFEIDEDGNALLTGYLNPGTYNEDKFPSGCISLYGAGGTVTSDTSPNDDIDGDYEEGTFLSVFIADGHLYFTYDTSEYAKRSVEWDLFEYGQENLEKLCWPTYTFSVDSANFMAMDEFVAFKNQFSLGSKVYLNLNGKILQPIAVGAEFNADDPTSFKLTFGDKYSLNDSAFKMVDLLEQSISIGQTTASKMKSFNAFVESGASGELYDYINSALDAAKNIVLAGSNQSTQIDGSGIRCRSYNPESGTFDDEQIWIINNQIVFTDDNWDTAKMAIGQTVDEKGFKIWGVVADALVGKMIAGQNLVIEAKSADGSIVEFRVDGSGVQLHNARFDLTSQSGQISLYPNTGFVGGKKSTAAPLYTYDEHNNITGIRTEKGNSLENLTNLDLEDLPNANFWIDMGGNAYFKGTVYAEDGVFNGTVYAEGGEFSGTVNALDLQLGGVSISEIVEAVGDDLGDLNYLKIGDITIDGKTGSISFANDTDIVLVQYATSSSGPWQDTWNNAWSGVSVWARYSYNGGTTWTGAMLIQGKNGVNGSDANVPDYIRGTYIDTTQVASCAIYGNEVYANGAFILAELEQNSSKSRVTVGDYYGMMGLATGMDVEGNRTYGVAMADGDTIELNDGTISFTSDGRYIIVTNKGIRLQAGSTTLTLTENGAYYNGLELGIGGEGGGVAVFG